MITRHICAAMFVLLLAAPTKAHDVDEGMGVICDTQAQIERFAALEVDLERLATINSGAQEPVCVLANVRYIRGREVSRIRMAKGTAQVVEILVLQVNLKGQWADIPPEVQYTLFLVDEVGA